LAEWLATSRRLGKTEEKIGDKKGMAKSEGDFNTAKQKGNVFSSRVWVRQGGESVIKGKIKSKREMGSRWSTLGGAGCIATRVFRGHTFRKKKWAENNLIRVDSDQHFGTGVQQTFSSNMPARRSWRYSSKRPKPESKNGPPQIDARNLISEKGRGKKKGSFRERPRPALLLAQPRSGRTEGNKEKRGGWSDQFD